MTSMTATTTAAAHDVGVGVIVVTVLGFGNRAPTSVVNFLVRQQQQQQQQLSAATVASGGGGDHLLRVQLQRSPGLMLPLLQHGIFATEDVVDSTETTKSADHHLIVYCIPTSVSEYLLFSTTEVAHVRSVLVESLTLTGSRGGRSVNTTKTTTVVVGYDAAKDQFVGINVVGQDGSSSIDEQLSSRDASASGAVLLQALAALEAQAANQLVLTSSKQGDTVLVVGSGGREHAIAVALAQSPLVSTVLCCPGNGGTQLEATSGASSSSSLSKIVNVGTGQDNTTVLDLLKLYQDDPNKHPVNMVVVGPEAPLVDGLVDAIHEQFPTVLVFGPTAAAAQLEASKAFSKDFLHDIGVPTANYKTFTDLQEALAYVESLGDDDRQVVKASGLAAGKGVLLPTTKAETLQAVREIMDDKAFGAAGDTIVIEQFLDGPEASCLAFCDGNTAVLMPAAQDHKRALDNDQGLNTGGMGAYAPAPCVTPALHQVIEEYCQRTVQHMAARGTPYIGVLYAGMMLTPKGPYVLEFNCRFGDPETQVLLPLLETDLYEVMMACCKGTLNQVDVRFTSGLCAATVVCAAAGYPEAYPKGMQVTGLEEANAIDNVKVYHAGTVVTEEQDAIVARCSGGRVLAVTGCGPSLQAALKTAYQGVSHLDFVDPKISSGSLMHYRTDIGRKAVDKKLRIGVMGSTRGSALVPVMDACANGSLDAEIVAILSNKSSAPILDKGRSLGATVTSKFLSSKGLTRTQYDAMCTSELIQAGVDYVLLVGYMRILSKEFCDYWSGTCVNVHPSLLPLHAGGMDLEVHQAVIDAHETESGCTIHLVTEAVDGGPILVQKRVAVDPGDTTESLKAKVQPLEGPAFVEAIQQHIRQQKGVGGGGAIRYVDAGVSIDAGNQLVDMIKPLCKATRRPGCDADLGGFGGLFDLSAAGFDASDTVLIGATDGVGTKLKVAQLVGKHETVGIDLVAMCVNDLIVAGGEPLFFLDYFATGHLEVHEAASVVKGIAEGCQQAGCGLIGGETAEMPSMYAPGEYDLAGFSVGAVSRNAILPRDVSSGDVLLGIASSGLHSNGFSLVRKLVEKQGLSYESPCPWDASFATVGDALLVPTQIYVKHCLPLLQNGLVKGMAHITGGGLLENLPRSMPKDLDAEIQFHPPLPPVFRWMKDASGLDDTEMLRTFNCGIGMVVIVSPDVKERALTMLRKSAGGGDGADVYELGHLVAGGSNRVVMLQSLN